MARPPLEESATYEGDEAGPEEVRVLAARGREGEGSQEGDGGYV